MSKNITVRLDNDSEKRLDLLKNFYENKGVIKYSYNDLIKIALRALAEDCELE